MPLQLKPMVQGIADVEIDKAINRAQHKGVPKGPESAWETHGPVDITVTCPIIKNFV